MGDSREKQEGWNVCISVNKKYNKMLKYPRNLAKIAWGKQSIWSISYACLFANYCHSKIDLYETVNSNVKVDVSFY